MQMKEYFKQVAEGLWKKHPGKCVCTLAGLLLAVCILLFGFWNMLFVLLLGGIGFFIGSNVDREGDTLQNLRDCIPRDIHRLK